MIQPLDLTDATVSWRLIGPTGLPVLENGDATITIVGAPSAGIVRIAVPNAKTATLPAGVYLDALQVSFDRLATLDRANSCCR